MNGVRDSLDREWVLASARERLLDGMARAVAERGYGDASVADVLRHSGVARKTFYAYFENKEDCFLAALELAATVLLRRLEAIVEEPGTPTERMERYTDAYLESIIAAPHFARLAIVEAPVASQRARVRSLEIRDRFAALLSRATECPRSELLPPDAVVSVTEAGDRLVARCLDEQGPEAIRSLRTTMLYVGASVLIGERAARRYLAEASIHR